MKGEKTMTKNIYATLDSEIRKAVRLTPEWDFIAFRLETMIASFKGTGNFTNRKGVNWYEIYEPNNQITIHLIFDKDGCIRAACMLSKKRKNKKEHIRFYKNKWA